MKGQTALTLDNWLYDMHGTRSLQRVPEFRDVAPISRGVGPVRDLPSDPVDLGGVELVDRAGATVTLDQHLVTSCTEGLLVVKDGVVVCERYLNGLRPDTLHMLASVTKSVTASVLGIEIGKGTLAAEDRVADIAPEFADSSIADATVQQVIDMTAGTDYSEVHDQLADPSGESPLIRFFRQAGTMPLGDAEPIGMIALFRQFPQAFPHGDHFSYRTPLTCAAGRILEIVTGRPYTELVSDDLWSRIGAEHDAAIVLDVVGFPFAGGGMLATLRDIARYGLAHLEEQSGIIPAAWIADTRMGTDDTRRAFDLDPNATAADLAQWTEYRNAFWVVEPGRIYEALGLFGQVCRINVETNTVIVRFSAQPMAERTAIGFETYRAHAAIEAALA